MDAKNEIPLRIMKLFSNTSYFTGQLFVVCDVYGEILDQMVQTKYSETITSNIT